MSETVVPDGLSTPQRHWAVLTIALAVGLAVLDGAIANIALPTIAADLHTSASASIWVVNAFQLAVMVSLLPLASVGEIYGYRRVYLVGVAVFTAASLLCATSHTLTGLTIARVVQGFGAAGVMSINTALIRYTYPRSMLGRGIGINALVVAGCSALGPTIASAILSVADWPWLFAVNVPLGLACLAIGVRALPVTPRAGHRFDAGSALLNALALTLLITGIDGYAQGEAPVEALLELAGSLVVGALLVRRQLSRPAPLLPVDLLRIPLFRLSILTSICSFTAQSLAFVALPFALEGAMGWNVKATGLLMTPWPLALAFVAPIAGRLADRVSAGILGGIGLAALCCGLLAMSLLRPDASALDVVWRMALCGVGYGFFQSPNNRAIVGSAPMSRAGGASGMLGTARLLGQSLGAALVAVIFSSGGGAHEALLLAAAMAGAGMLASVMRIARRPV